MNTNQPANKEVAYRHIQAARPVNIRLCARAHGVLPGAEGAMGTGKQPPGVSVMRTPFSPRPAAGAQGVGWLYFVD